MTARADALASLCQKHGIDLVYLFGSQAETALAILHGHTPSEIDPLADIDVGVVLSNPLPSGRDRARLYSLIFNDFEDLFLPFSTDLVFLLENHSVFQAEAVRGNCVYRVAPAIQDAYEEAVLRRACDFRPFLELYYAELLEG